MNAINDVKAGRDPMHVLRDPDLNNFAHLAVISEVIPAAANVKEYVSNLVEKR
jgi:hypothetical protein